MRLSSSRAKKPKKLWLLALPGIRRNLVDERLLLARSVAHGLDTSLSTAIQALGRLAGDLPDLSDAGVVAARLRAFRFQSPFSEAIYLLEADGRLRRVLYSKVLGLFMPSEKGEEQQR